MDLSHLARALAVTNTLADAALIVTSQRTYDGPGGWARRRRQLALGAAYAGVICTTDLIWNQAVLRRTGRRPWEGVAGLSGPDGPLLPAHETQLLSGITTVCLAWGLPWWLGRGLPGALRRRGVERPNTLLATPLGVAFAATTAPVWWRHARGRQSDLH